VTELEFGHALEFQGPRIAARLGWLKFVMRDASPKCRRIAAE